MAKGKALLPRKLKCSKCGKTVFDTVITRHMWRSHRDDMMANRGGRKKSRVDKLLGGTTKERAIKAEALRFSLAAHNDKKLKVTLYQGDCHLLVTDVTRIEVREE